jgi:TrmH family RNA methyltransferase
VNRITSRHHPIVARYRAVARGDDAGVLLLDGLHLVGDALAAGLRIEQAAVALERLRQPDARDVTDRLARAGVEVVAASPSVMDALSPVRSSSAIVALAERPCCQPARLYDTAVPVVIIAVDVQDPGNLGAIVRVAEAGGATGAVAAGRSADPFGWKALRGSMGSALRLPIVVDEVADRSIADARRHGCRIIATAPRDGRSPFEIDLTGPIAVLIGGEGPGLSPAVLGAADERVTIPMQPPVESLNAAVTAALLVYEAHRQRDQVRTGRTPRARARNPEP